MASQPGSRAIQNSIARWESRQRAWVMPGATGSNHRESQQPSNFTLEEVFLMAHIRLPEGIPGILGPMAFSPETARPLNELAEVLLRGPNTLTPADREMIATYVSSQNDCYFCQHAHGAVAAYRLGGNEKLVNEVKLNFESAEISGTL